MKKCLIDECEYCHEGYCILDIVENINPNICKAKSSEDLIDDD